jgi:hypothetical protein
LSYLVCNAQPVPLAGVIVGIFAIGSLIALIAWYRRVQRRKNSAAAQRAPSVGNIGNSNEEGACAGVANPSPMITNKTQYPSISDG